MNTVPTKALRLGALLLMALICGLWLSGFLTLWLLDLHIPPHVGTYVQHWRALDLPVVRPYASTILLAGRLGFGLPLASWAIVAVMLVVSPRARFPW